MTDTAAQQQKIVPIFSGGGTRLSAHIGILQALLELNYRFDSLVGVSGGSIVSSLYSAGMSLEDIKRLALNTDFRQFREFSILRLLFEGGLASGDFFEQWMDEQLQGRTFADIPMRLNILATDLNSGAPVIFNRERCPDLKISKAVRYSMSIPLIFSFKKYQDSPLTDGAILAEDALFDDWNGDGTPGVCFRLKSNQDGRKPNKIHSLVPLKHYVELLIRTFMTAISREYVNAQYWHNTVVINTGEVSAVDFNLTKDAKNQLFEVGYQTAKQYVPLKLHNIYPYRQGSSLQA